MAVGRLSKRWDDGSVLESPSAINATFKQTLADSTMAFLLQGCTKSKDLDGARCVQSAIVECGYDWSVKLGCQLIHLYGSCRCLPDADKVFSALHEQTTNSWTAIISAHADHGQAERAILLYRQMQFALAKPNLCTFVAALKSCACTEALAEGRLIHSDLIKQGLETDVCTGNTLIDMYCKCNSLRDARKTFDDMQTWNVVSWNCMLSGYIQLEHNENAIELLKKMHQHGMEASNVTLLFQLKLCASRKTLDEGRLIHDQVYTRGFESDIFLGNALLNMYAKCNKLNDAHNVFNKLHSPNVVAWSVMIHGYAENGHGEDALKMFVRMRMKGIRPDEITFVCVLKACATIRALEQGRLIHIDALKCDLVSSVFMGSILVVMYIKCGSILDARRVFDKLAGRNVVSWSSIIEGYAEQGQGEEALELFKNMHKEGVEPNGITFMCSIKACTSIGATDQGRVIHGNVIEDGLESDVVIGNTLIDMYAKGGFLKEAVRVFDFLKARSLESWSALIAGYANYGHLRLAKHYFQGMCEQGIEPDLIAFLSLLYACSHAGLLKEAHFHFNCMINIFGIAPTKEHCACMVDMFGRAGLLGDAEVLICTMPFLPDSILWKTLLSSCVRHNDPAASRRAFESLLNTDCKIAVGYVLMSNASVANIIGEDG